MLTRAGWGVLGSAVALFVASWLLGYPALAVLGAACTAALLVAVGWVLHRPQLEVNRLVRPTRVAVGEPAMGVVTVTNVGRFPSASLTARDGLGTRQAVEVPLPRLGSGATRETTYRLPTDRRAALSVGPLKIGRVDPFGLMRWEQRRGAVETVFVYPRTHAIPALPSGQRRSLDGPTNDSSPHGSINFNTLREYVIGDDLRHVHWRSTAHTGTLMVKQHVDSSLPHTTIVLDTNVAGHSVASFEEAIEVVASIVLATAGSEFPVRLLTTGGLAVGGAGRNDLTAIFDRLAALEPSPTGRLIDIAESLHRQTRGGSLVLVTGRVDPVEFGALARVQRRYESVTLVAMRDTHDEPLPALNKMTTLDVSTAREFAHLWSRLVKR